MSRNEMFLLLACAVITAMMSSPARTSRHPPVTLASLLTPAQDVVASNEAGLVGYDLERP